MRGHPPISDTGLLLGSIFVAVSIVGIGILGGQQVPEQTAAVSPNAMTAAAPAAGAPAAKQRCLQEKDVSGGAETPCVNGCQYLVKGGYFPVRGDITASTVYSDGSNRPGIVQYLSYGASSWTKLTCTNGKLGSATNGAQTLTSFIGSEGGMGITQPTSPTVGQPTDLTAGLKGGPANGGSGTGNSPSGATSLQSFYDQDLGGATGATGQPAPCPGSSNTGDIKCFMGTYDGKPAQYYYSAGSGAPGAGGAPGTIPSIEGLPPPKPAIPGSVGAIDPLFGGTMSDKIGVPPLYGNGLEQLTTDTPASPTAANPASTAQPTVEDIKYNPELYGNNTIIQTLGGWSGPPSTSAPTATVGDASTVGVANQVKTENGGWIKAFVPEFSDANCSGNNYFAQMWTVVTSNCR